MFTFLNFVAIFLLLRKEVYAKLLIFQSKSFMPITMIYLVRSKCLDLVLSFKNFQIPSQRIELL